MNRDWGMLSPAALALAFRLLALAVMVSLWFLGPAAIWGLIILLALTISSLAFWRFPGLPPWTLLVVQAALSPAIFFWPDSVYGLSLPIFEAFLGGVPWLALPSLAIIFIQGGFSLPLVASSCLASLFGLTLRSWSMNLAAARKESDRDRRERYDLENLKADLIAATIRSAKMAELAERARIARDLHDNVGHELTAAHLALQAHARLADADDPRAREMLDQGSRRLSDGLELLRNTLRGMAPARAGGLDTFEDICARFTVCPVALEVHGDTERIPIHVWTVLEPCLKEALSNGARHGGATRILVSLDLGPRIVRLSVHNAGGGAEEPGRGGRAEGLSADSRGSRGDEGLGLRNLRRRARAIGGTVSVDESEGYRLVCVLPLEGSGEYQR